MRMTLGRIRNSLGAVGDLGPAREKEIVRVQTDSRLVCAGDLFVCLPGEHFDGHTFAGEAARKGATAILSQMPLPEIDSAAVLLVTDTRAALGRLAAIWRLGVASKVVAVTGSAGKTTLKEMIAAILATRYKTAKNYKNFNNQIGLPLSMLACGGEEDVWVMELGVSEPGDMDDLAAIAMPDLAVIHNVGAAHLEKLGSVAGVAAEKCKLLRHLRPGGTALASRDYPELWSEARRLVPRTRSLSRSDETADFFAVYEGPDGDGGGRFRIRLEGEEFSAGLPFCGAHFAENVAAAAGVAWLMGLGPEEITEGLRSTRVPEHRFHCRPCGDWTLIDDTYNANPLSMRGAIEGARAMAGERSLVLVLGDMLELGPGAEEEHERLGGIAAAAGPEAVYFRGAHGAALERGLARAGFEGRFRIVESATECVSLLAPLLEKGSGVVLVKGSRSGRMENFASAILEKMRQPRGAATT